MRVVWQTLALLGKFATSYVGLVLLSLLVITVSMNALASAQTRWGLLRLVQFSQSTFAPEALADYSALTEVRSMVVRFEGGAETLREAVTSLSSMIPAVSARLIEEVRRDDVARASAAIESAFGLSVDTARAAAAQALGASGLDALRSRAATPKPAGSGSAGSGAPGLRQAIGGNYQRFYGMGVDPEREVTVCCGATEAMLATLMATVNPGDEVIVIAPFYENYWPDTVLAGATPRFVHLREPVRVL
ncbi:MAG TPA: aminotransferase class I/II-fold pyridoxal phosphate-dependent enzyme, partial [Chloroflexota bacterium]|nr:aminotransferase class I/II-fold pyridoxal phosphate-dependent enzyme [Chloroflexota bacterium]